jgi:hypothetical protein
MYVARVVGVVGESINSKKKGEIYKQKKERFSLLFFNVNRNTIARIIPIRINKIMRIQKAMYNFRFLD